MTEISIELNTQITNDTDTDDVVQGLTYTLPGGTLILEPWTIMRGKIRKYSRTTAWGSRGEISTDFPMLGINLPDTMRPSTVTIGGIMADASAVGNGEEITATVMVNGVMADWQSG